jgi:hypothetical protein
MHTSFFHLPEPRVGISLAHIGQQDLAPRSGPPCEIIVCPIVRGQNVTKANETVVVSTISQYNQYLATSGYLKSTQQLLEENEQAKVFRDVLGNT